MSYKNGNIEDCSKLNGARILNVETAPDSGEFHPEIPTKENLRKHAYSATDPDCIKCSQCQ